MTSLPSPLTRSTLWRLTTNHGDDALLLGIVENLFSARLLFVVKGGIQTVTVAAVSDFTNRLRCQREGFGDMWGCKSLTKLK